MQSQIFAGILLEAEHIALLKELVAGDAAVPEDQDRRFILQEHDQAELLFPPGQRGRSREVRSDDIHELARQNLLSVEKRGARNWWVTVRPFGRAYLRQLGDSSMPNVEGLVLGYIELEAFRQSYPSAHAHWVRAYEEGKQGVPSPLKVGEECDAALLDFAAELLIMFSVPEYPKDRRKTLDRLRSVIAYRAPLLGKTEKPFLDALLSYWATLGNLIQRQRHGAEREGESLDAEDARRVVFHTALVMYEVDRAVRRGKPR